jgi:hypothetical protein
MSELTVGTILGGRYRLVSLVAHDEVGARTFRAERLEDGRALRLSAWNVRRAPTPEQVARLAECLRAAEQVASPAFPRVLDSGFDADAGVLWSVREQVPGELPLPVVLRRTRAGEGLSQPWLLYLVTALNAALWDLYPSKRVHGRLRPSRVHLVPSPTGVRVLVEDLGLEDFRRTEGRALLKLREEGDVFLAPELAAPAPLTPRTDTYGFGEVVREMDATRHDPSSFLRSRDAVPLVWFNQATKHSPSARFHSPLDAWDTLRFLVNFASNLAPPRPPTEEDLFAVPSPDEEGPSEPAPEPPQVRSPTVGPADFSDFVEAFARALPDAERREHPEGVDFHAAFGVVHLRQDGTLEVDGLRWELPLYQRRTVVPRFVDLVLEVVRLCDGTLRAATPEWQDATFGRLRLQRQMKPTPHWRFGPALVVPEPERFVVLHSHEAWVTSHDLERVDTAFLWLPYAKLPEDGEKAVAVLFAAARTAGLMNVSPEYVCRFCQRTFTSLHFHPDYGACHGCSERHLGVVH